MTNQGVPIERASKGKGPATKRQKQKRKEREALQARIEGRRAE